MAIRMVPDVGAPLVVAGVNIASRTAFPEYHDWVVYGMTALGYIGAWMGWGGEFLKMVGVSSLPLTADKIYDRVRGGASKQVGSLAFRQRVSRYPAPVLEAQFAGARLV